ncbi:MAG: OmpA family protein [Gemmatimonadaceae bacterium]|nr:OmpA family protein [Gemmatimonadaceae bacterium]
MMTLPVRALSLGLLAVLVGCASGAPPSGARLTPVSRRITDAAIARDLAVFGELRQRAVRAADGASGGRRYLAARAAAWLALAQHAYERNDRSAFPEDMIVLAERDLIALESRTDSAVTAVGTAVLFPNDVRLFDDDAWGRALALRSAAGEVGAPDEIARAEALLVRQGNRILAGPACLGDAEASRHAAAILAAVERTRVAPTPVLPDPPRVVEERPAPVPQPDSARLPRLCAAPERLTGVPAAVHFALDRNNLTDASRTVLDRTVAALREFPGVRIRLSGHTDPRHNDAYNDALSQRRVDAVTDYLRQQGVDPSRVIRAEALGERQLLTRGTTAREQARNRRVDIVYVRCDGSELVPEETLDDLQLERRDR